MAPTTPQGRKAAGDARRAGPDDPAPTTPLSFRVPQDKRDALRRVADEEGVTVSELLGRLVDDLVANDGEG